MLVSRAELRLGPEGLADAVGVPARTISRILARNQVPRLAECDPLTGARIRATKATAVRYERERPGELVHIDVKKLRRIPPGGGWRVHGRGNAGARARVGFDYVHSAVDDHSRFAYSEICPDERGATAAGFIERAAEAFAAVGIAQIEEILTDNHLSYRNSTARSQASWPRKTQGTPEPAQYPGRFNPLEILLRSGLGLIQGVPGGEASAEKP